MLFQKLTFFLLSPFQPSNNAQHPLLPPPSPTPEPEISSHQQPLNWSQINPSTTLTFHPCFPSLHSRPNPSASQYDCARLTLPLDHHNISNTHTTTLALIKLPALVPVTSPQHGGAVILNPGGPGGSGIAQVLREGREIRDIISAPSNLITNGDEGAKFFDIIGFDPRGVNNSRPVLACFADHREASAWSLLNGGLGVLGLGGKEFDYGWGDKRGVARDCSVRNGGEGGIAGFMSTAMVATDIVSIVERYGEWREKELERMVQGEDGGKNEEVLERTRYKKGQEMVQYWGFSYGTVLGATLLSMFPERIGRAVLDGVADSFDYMAGGWKTNLFDTDKLMDTFPKHCFDGGEMNCPIYNSKGPKAIFDDISKTLTNLWHNPIAMPGTNTRGPHLITWNDMYAFIRMAVYNGLRDFPRAATILHELTNRNGTSLSAWRESQMPPYNVPLPDECLKDGPYSAACNILHLPNSLDGVLCSDVPDMTNTTKEEYRAYTDFLVNQSSIMGASWADVLVPCTAWLTRAAWKYQGNFTSKPAHPPLFVGNTIDPVTPVRNARKMAEGFGGARVLEIGIEGHCSSAGISMCAAKAIRRYFQTGELPVEDYCRVDRVPFDGYTRDIPVDEIEVPEGEDDLELWRTLIKSNRG